MYLLPRPPAWVLAFGLIILPSLAAATDWQRVEEALGAKGSPQPGQVYKFSLPRTDLAVSLDGIALKPALALGSWLAFQEGKSTTLLMGDLVLTPAEVSPVMQQLAKGGIQVTALHNHLLRTTPTPWYMHIAGQGDPIKLAQTLRAALARSATPKTTPGESAAGKIEGLDTVRLEETLGRTGKASGGVYKFAVPRAETIQLQGISVAPSMGLATALSFQPIGANHAVIYGDFVLRAEEVNPVLRTLRAHNIEVMAVHNHLLGEEPRLFFMHFWSHGEAEKLAQGLQAALAQLQG